MVASVICHLMTTYPLIFWMITDHTFRVGSNLLLSIYYKFAQIEVIYLPLEIMSSKYVGRGVLWLVEFVFIN